MFREREFLVDVPGRLPVRVSVDIGVRAGHVRLSVEDSLSLILPFDIAGRLGIALVDCVVAARALEGGGRS